MNTDLNDDLSDLLGGKPGEFAPAKQPPAFYTEQVAPMYTENCGKCGGSGYYRGFGKCFACKGKGKFTYKTSTADRAKAREQRANREQAKRVSFTDEHKAEIEFLTAAAARPNTTWALPADLLDKLAKYGSWTDGQVDMIRKIMARDAEKKAAWAAERAELEASAKTVDSLKLDEHFWRFRKVTREQNSQVGWIKLPLDTFVFVHAPAKGNYQEAIFVNEGERKLGRIVGGKFIRTRECDDATEARILEAAANPGKAARAYGRRWNICCCCGATLTNEKSRIDGIGPICATRWGF